MPANAPAAGAGLVTVQQLAPRARLAASARTLLRGATPLNQKLPPDRAKCAPLPRVRANCAALAPSTAPGKFMLIVANAKLPSSSRTHLLTDGLRPRGRAARAYRAWQAAMVCATSQTSRYWWWANRRRGAPMPFWRVRLNTKEAPWRKSR